LEAVEKIFWQIFVAISAKTCLTETACRNLKKSAKIAKETRHFIATKNTLINIARITRITK